MADFISATVAESTDRVLDLLDGPFDIEGQWLGFGGASLSIQRNPSTQQFEVTGSVDVQLDLNLDLDVTSRLPKLPSSVPYTLQIPKFNVKPEFTGKITIEITSSGPEFWIEGSAKWGNKTVTVPKFTLQKVPTKVSDLIKVVENKIKHDVLQVLIGSVNLTLKLGSRTFFKGDIPMGR